MKGQLSFLERMVSDPEEQTTIDLQLEHFKLPAKYVCQAHDYQQWRSQEIYGVRAKKNSQIHM